MNSSVDVVEPHSKAVVRGPAVPDLWRAPEVSAHTFDVTCAVAADRLDEHVVLVQRIET